MAFRSISERIVFILDFTLTQILGFAPGAVRRSSNTSSPAAAAAAAVLVAYSIESLLRPTDSVAFCLLQEFV